jgi:hypothetical protein
MILAKTIASNITAKIREVQTYVFVKPYFYLYKKHKKFCGLHYVIKNSGVG